VSDELDNVILSMVSVRWRKVALVMALANDQIGETKLDVSFEDIAARIKALVQTGRLESQGNLDRWRHSEVRLPVPSPNELP
jgi:hypothetical protein